MFPELKGKILFVFSDPGGAKPLLALAEKYPDSIVVSDREHPFYKDFKVQVHIADGNYEKIINQHAPHQVVTGTSYRSDIEKIFHRLCAQTHTPCYAFIDHWTSMRVRFEQPDGNLLIPDNVCVIDERAKNIAVTEGIDVGKILITGNPYHLWLMKWKPSITKNDFLKMLGIEKEYKKIILYAPDPLSNIDGIKLYGFDEITATIEIINRFESNSQLKDNVMILVKSHPNQRVDSLYQVIPESLNFMILPINIDTNTTIYYSDAVIGFFSSILIEASILKKKVIRYINVDLDIDPILKLKIGIKANNENINRIILETLLLA